MIRFFSCILMLSCWGISVAQGQSHTPSTPYHASFQLTYDRTTQEYTFWLVPNYSTPNVVNSNAQESGVGIGVTLMVPEAFTIERFTGLVANWDSQRDKNFKLGPRVPGQDLWPLELLPPHVNYYSYGIVPFSTYAPFLSGIPIPSFRFKGNGCFGDIRIVEKEDPIIQVASEGDYQLNIENYFVASSASRTTFSPPRPLDNHFFSNVGPNASCFLQTELVAKSDTFQVAQGQTSAQFNVLFNDDKNRIPVAVRDTRLRILQPPTHGNLTVTPNQQIQYQSPAGSVPSFSFQYEVCLVSEPTQCDTATVVVRGSGPPTTRVVQCEEEETQLSVPEGWLDVRWFRDGVLVGSGPTFAARESGRYSVRASNQTCPAKGCLEIEVITEICCLDSLQIPAQTRKVKRR